MAEISATLVKQLRDKTGAGMGDCKKALIETGGDVDRALDFLRAKGVKASQADRAAAEGAVAFKVSADHKAVAVVELRCETDFAARSENFVKLVGLVAEEVLKHRPADAAAASNLPAVKTGLQEAGAMTIRENIVLAHAEVLALEGPGRVAAYVHHNGSVGVAVAVSGPDSGEEFVRELAMHVTAHDPSPVAIDRDGVPADLVARERAIYLKQIDENPADAKKPANIKEKMIEGRLRKFYEDRALLEQKFVKNPEQSISDLLAQKGKELGGALKVAWFVRRSVGG